MDWNIAYSNQDYRYGKEPVPFLRQAVDGHRPGKALCIGAGEGRNAVWLATIGYDVTALDLSSVGLRKAEKLAAENGVDIATVSADASTWDMGRENWDLVTAFFVHPPSKIREEIHRRAAAALAYGGRLVIQGFTPRQLGRESGGPGHSKTGKVEDPADVADRFIEPEDLRTAFSDLQIELLEEREIDLIGGTHHAGKGMVVQCIAIRTTLPTRTR